VEDGKMADARSNIAVVVLDEEGNPKSRWEFAEAWPTKYDAPDLNATGNDIAVETLEIAHESMVRVS
jgi:phage tail-like protein